MEDDDDDDGDELTAQPPVPPPVTRSRGPSPPKRSRGRPRGRAWGPPPPRRPDTSGRGNIEPLPEVSSHLSTRLSTRHTRRGSGLASPPKRLKPPQINVTSSPDELHGEGNANPSANCNITSGSLCDAGLLLQQFLAPTAGQHGVITQREGERENEDSNEDIEEEESPTRRYSNRVTRRSNRVASRGRPRATSIDSSLHETPRRLLRNRSIRNPSFSPGRIPRRPAGEKPKFYNSEFRKCDTQRHHLGDRTIICPHCQAYMWKDELSWGGSVTNPEFEVC